MNTLDKLQVKKSIQEELKIDIEDFKIRISKNLKLNSYIDFKEKEIVISKKLLLKDNKINNLLLHNIGEKENGR